MRRICREELTISALLVVVIFLCLLLPLNSFAHPGRTDRYGCHHCWTNCEKWGLSYGEYHCHKTSGSYELPSGEIAEAKVVKRVIDGDTIELSNGEKVRLIGVDTPETKDPRKPVQYFGQEAYKFTKGLAEGEEVRIEYDQQRKDRYGRILGYVFFPDGHMLNEEIIKQGYGHAYIKYPFKYMERFQQLEREAREHKRGLWREKSPSQEE